MVDTMRKGADLVVTGESGRGTKSTDRYTLQGPRPGARPRRAGVQVTRCHAASRLRGDKLRGRPVVTEVDFGGRMDPTYGSMFTGSAPACAGESTMRER